MTSSQGKLFVISAPSGAGKTTLVKRLVESDPELRFSISYTTRPQREGEVDGRDYNFVTVAEFEELLAAGEFLEHARVFDNYYGTSNSQVQQTLDAGHHVILEIDWQGAQQVRDKRPDCESIFVLPPSVAELTRRLRGRGTDSDEVIERRLGDALSDMGHWNEFRYAVINDDLDQAAAEMTAIVAGAGQDLITGSAAVQQAVGAILD